MYYKKYIDLGFKRIDMNDSVEFSQTGFYGFVLEKKLNKKIMLGVSSGELDRPLLYISKKGSDTYHIIPIKEDCLIDLCNIFK
jgi:hypothetical protein